jgi:hypothetical protein
MLWQRGVLGREDCLKAKVASSKFLTSFTASLIVTTDRSRIVVTRTGLDVTSFARLHLAKLQEVEPGSSRITSTRQVAGHQALAAPDADMPITQLVRGGVKPGLPLFQN